MAFASIVAAGCGASPTYAPAMACQMPASALCPGDYFKDGAFVARITWLSVERCSDGPASFAAPSCPGDDMKLPACQ